MSFEFSNMNEILSQETGSIFHRHILILAGDESWQKDFLKKLLLGYEHKTLWLADSPVEDFPFVETKNAHSWLGNEQQIVVFDANTYFDPDSFAAINGVVVGGGLFILLLPSKDKWIDVYSSRFGQRFIQSIQSRSNFFVVSQQATQITLSKLERTESATCTAPFLTLDQQNSASEIEKNIVQAEKIPIVLMSDRGRGKSATLGIVAAKLIKKEIENIAITAPSLRTANIFFKHLAELLPNASVSKNSVNYNGNIVQFYSPDQLTNEDVNVDVLLIDEAAAIPVPILTSFLHKYPQCVFATTVHGYEGTGRGFSLRFFKELDRFNSSWLKLKMKTPIRWADNDPLEKWAFDLLCLDAELTNIKKIGDIDIDKLEYKLLSKDSLFENKILLNEVFSLLVLAHYRTRPKDLKSLLDDESISVYVSLKDKHVIAVSLVIEEGGFSDSLSTLVYRGKRRPQGHLLAQALTYHCGIENAATLNYARVMRIAVHPSLQNKGIGSELLNFIVQSEKEIGRDAIGTSFGLNERLLSFWEKQNFSVVRLGFTREKTSGEHAAIMSLGLTQNGKATCEQAHSRFYEQIPYWFDDVLKDIPTEIKDLFKNGGTLPVELSDFDNRDIESFSQYSRNYELCISSINKFVMLKKNDINSKTFPRDFRLVLTDKVMGKKSWQEIRLSMSLNGQHDARSLFRQAIIELLA